jgi:hypothetical protein
MCEYILMENKDGRGLEGVYEVATVHDDLAPGPGSVELGMELLEVEK